MSPVVCPAPQVKTDAINDNSGAAPRTIIWGVPFDPVTHEEVISRAGDLIAGGRPGYAVTANLHYLMLCHESAEMRELNDNAAMVIADGMPIVWRSRLMSRPLPERVAGSDLIYSLSELAATQGYRVFFLGAAPGVAEQCANRLREKFPGLEVAGVECPPFRPLSDQEEEELAERIRDARPDILFAALGQPHGELWIRRWYKKLGIPLCMQVGGSFNFVIGRVTRCPAFIARIGLEWIWRMGCEPRRLAGRYGRNLLFLLRATWKDLTGR